MPTPTMILNANVASCSKATKAFNTTSVADSCCKRKKELVNTDEIAEFLHQLDN
ncbi:hypothetical protein HJA79_27105 [Rhizobium bangladeshense]|nr:hypothetical protein [Rhizobium bangladeshense]